MNVILLVFLSLLTSAEATRKFISPRVALPGDYLEEEKEEDDDVENYTNAEQNPVSDNADLLQRNTAQEARQEGLKVNVILVLSCATLACSLILMICCFMTIFMRRMEKGNFCHTFRCSCEQQRPASTFYFHPLKGVPDSSVSRASEKSLRGEKTASDIQSNGKVAKSETLPILNSVADISISHSSSLSSIPSHEDLNGDHN